ncbi:hypothetical protein ACGFX8_07735 [Streptomyces sp. NPDC048362]|uniref:hypothetical protein n=1 Tax=Streptomyces sp. NPDC048362 TaxID=3365539 RepID=UPI00371CEC72
MTRNDRVCAPRPVNLPQCPVVGWTLRWAAAQEQAARIAGGGMKADAFEGVV